VRDLSVHQWVRGARERRTCAASITQVPAFACPPRSRSLDCVLTVPHRESLLERVDSVARSAADCSKAAPSFSNCKMLQHTVAHVAVLEQHQ